MSDVKEKAELEMAPMIATIIENTKKRYEAEEEEAKQIAPASELLTQAQIADRLGVHIATVSKRIASLGLKPVIPARSLGDEKGREAAKYSWTDFAILQQQQQQIANEKEAALARAVNAVKPEVRVALVRTQLEAVIEEKNYKDMFGIAMMMAQGLAEMAKDAEGLDEQNKRLEAEKETLRIQLEQSREWFSIKRVAVQHNVEWRTFNWRKLKEASLSIGKEVKKIFDANYGEVNVYHVDAWQAAYPDYAITMEY